MKKTRDQVMSALLEDKVKFGTVSGIWTTKPNIIRRVDDIIPEIMLITTKSYQVDPNPGNHPPILTEPSPGNFGNAVGLRNPGMEKGYLDIYDLVNPKGLRSILNVSVSANSIENFILLIKKFEPIADIIELNFSCPHAKEGYGASIGSYPDVVRQYMSELRKATNALLFPKLTPNAQNIGEIAKIAVECGANGISAINTVGPETYIHEDSGKPILYNRKGHKGGKSGSWIRGIALDCIREIRGAVGRNVPIIGMGGVSHGQHVEDMRAAGANVVCIGSGIIKVPDIYRPEYFKTLSEDVKNRTDKASVFISKDPRMDYKAYTVKKIIDAGNGLRIIETDGGLNASSSQYGFIFDPNTSAEGPFSIVKANPLTFLVKKQPYDPENSKGLVTNAIFDFKKGDKLFFRGVYGAKAKLTDKNEAHVLAGGTGLAIVPQLVKELKEAGKEVTVYCGVTDEKHAVFKEEIEKYATYFIVPDEGIPGRAINIFNDESKESGPNVSAYIMGPPAFTKKAMDISKQNGLNPKDIYVNVEKMHLCGVGACGECECGGEFSCERGTFYTLDFIEKNKVDIIKLKDI